MAPVDAEKRRRILEGMRGDGMQALVLRYPENVVYATGYWPCFGWSTCVYPLDGEPVLILPEFELPYARKSEFGDLRAIREDYAESTLRAVSQAVSELKLERAVLGVECSFETVAANHVGGEANFPNAPSFKRMRAKLRGCKMVDATSLLYRLRSVKSAREVEKLLVANKIAEKGLQAARDALKPGIRESELASRAEGAIHSRGVGYRGTSRARGFAFVMSGPLSAGAWMPFNISTSRRIREGDLVLMELNAYADGYWSDLTRVWTCGKPAPRQLEIYDAVLGAQREAIASLSDGVPAEKPYLEAKKILSQAGYGAHYPHGLGHGVGARMHEPIPALGPGSKEPLRKGMVHSVEPGVYIPGYGGVRIEDDVLDLKKGAAYLSTFERALET
ncbi:MAG: aminopeptidase P family protein [Candidatus Brockarchaeota archaeon]|nr:aminopeptidase P family protein [Candidatus Brockarchaeota archaeon]